MLSETGSVRVKLFKNNKYRKTEHKYRDHLTGDFLPVLDSLKAGAQVPKISPYAFRSYNRHFAIERYSIQ